MSNLLSPKFPSSKILLLYLLIILLLIIYCTGCTDSHTFVTVRENHKDGLYTYYINGNDSTCFKCTSTYILDSLSNAVFTQCMMPQEIDMRMLYIDKADLPPYLREMADDNELETLN